ncbi:hypothetical protein PG995_001208 [Apiospora arundinis]
MCEEPQPQAPSALQHQLRRSGLGGCIVPVDAGVREPPLTGGVHRELTKATVESSSLRYRTLGGLGLAVSAQSIAYTDSQGLQELFFHRRTTLLCPP